MYIRVYHGRYCYEAFNILPKALGLCRHFSKKKRIIHSNNKIVKFKNNSKNLDNTTSCIPIDNNSKNLNINSNSKVEIPIKIEEKEESSVDNNDLNSLALKATKIGALANISLASIKLAAGYVVSSTALIADAVSSYGDLLCDAVVFFSVKEARKEVSINHPWGRGKMESIGALSVSGLLLVTGISIGYSSLFSAIDLAADLNLVHSVSENANFSNFFLFFDAMGDFSSLFHSESHIKSYPAHFAALGVSGLSILAKEWLFRYTLKAGEKSNSSAVIANAWQHRSDVSTSAAVFLGLCGSLVGFPLLDPMAALLVSGVIVKQGITTGMESIRDLNDAPADKEETELLKDECLSVKGVKSVEELKARKSGPFLFVEVIIGVDGNISASAAHRIAELVKHQLLENFKNRVANVVVHINPNGSSGLGELATWTKDHDEIEDGIKDVVLKIKEIIAVSEVQVYYKDNGKIMTKVDIVLPSNFTISQAHIIATKAKEKIQTRFPGMDDIDVDLELDES